MMNVLYEGKKLSCILVTVRVCNRFCLNEEKSYKKSQTPQCKLQHHQINIASNPNWKMLGPSSAHQHLHTHPTINVSFPPCPRAPPAWLQSCPAQKNGGWGGGQKQCISGCFPHVVKAVRVLERAGEQTSELQSQGALALGLRVRLAECAACRRGRSARARSSALRRSTAASSSGTAACWAHGRRRARRPR